MPLWLWNMMISLLLVCAAAGATAAVFLSVFKWEARKGWRELVEAFNEAFTSDDAVELIILTKPFFGSGTVRGFAGAKDRRMGVRRRQELGGGEGERGGWEEEGEGQGATCQKRFHS